MRRPALGRPDDFSWTSDGRGNAIVAGAASSRRGWAWALASALVLVLVAGCSGTAVAAGATDQAPTVSPLGHAVVFTRFLPGADQGAVYRIDAGGTVEHLIRAGVLDFALLSRDGTQFTDMAPTPDGRGSACIFNVDGLGYRVLPIPDPTLELPGGTWSAGNSRIVSGGGDPNDPTRVGLYSRRSSDGGDLIRLTDAGTRADLPIQSSPDGSKLLFFRPDARNQTSDSAPQDLFVVGADGSGLTRLTPPGITTAVVSSYDSVSWSPDGTQVAVAGANGPFWNTTLRSVYIASADGSSFRRVGPLGNIWDAVWSPDGRWIAFSMASKATGGRFQLYLMRPDGSGVRQLTSGTDGLFSLHPTWSPDSSQLLFLRGTSNVNLTDIWSINLDGSHLYQVTHQPAGYGTGEALAWLP
jgi:Tol biopolymer transport system component